MKCRTSKNLKNCVYLAIDLSYFKFGFWISYLNYYFHSRTSVCLFYHVYSQWPVQTNILFSSHVWSAFGWFSGQDIFNMYSQKRSILLDREKCDCKNFFVPQPQGLESIYGRLKLYNYKRTKRIESWDIRLKFQLSSFLSLTQGNSWKESFYQHICF